MPPCAMVYSCTSLLMSSVDMPAWMFSATISRISVFSLPALRMPSSCAGVLMREWGGTFSPLDFSSASFSSKSAWQTLYFFPLPHQQGSLRPIFI